MNVGHHKAIIGIIVSPYILLTWSLNWQKESSSVNSFYGAISQCYYKLSFFHRLETHLMMSLAYGKISASAARLALAKKMIKVYNVIYRKRSVCFVILRNNKLP